MPSPILPWGRVLKEGTAWRGLSRGIPSFILSSEPKLCFIDYYLSSLQSRINSTSSYLDVILIDVISKIKANKDLNKTTAKALLDTGSLAGDFISNDFIVDLNLVNYVEIDNNEIQICSGLDNNCSSTLGSITLSLSFKNEVNNKTEFVTLVFKNFTQKPN